MENASKALGIAGGILIAIILLGLIVSTYQSISSYSQAEQDTEASKQLAQFNQQYEKYRNQSIYGQELASLINNVKDNNKKEYYKINVFVDGENVTNLSNPKEIYAKPGYIKYYKCNGIGYDNTTGRVNSVSFIKINV